jgi:hypothetical protein
MVDRSLDESNVRNFDVSIKFACAVIDHYD